MRKKSEKILFKGNWLTLKELIYINDHGLKIKWETIERKNKKQLVVILAKLLPSDRYVLIRQFRPAVNNFVIGLPAGIMDTINIKKEALKELREETGFYGKKIIKVSPVLALNPALITDRVQIAYISIDETAKKNINPQQKLEPEEQIEVFLIKKENILNFLQQRQRKYGDEISAAVWYIFNGTNPLS